ncbi:hypothetical protein M514_22766 [Trichuris suis]|uniref:Uncharacterized protein n=1 Tax=Trichuris suis TaxID=68888 RepID=A0A085N6F3_9BILA|nr:hypothetical protein M514_22766 [Trichuris suis]
MQYMLLTLTVSREVRMVSPCNCIPSTYTKLSAYGDWINSSLEDLRKAPVRAEFMCDALDRANRSEGNMGKFPTPTARRKKTPREVHEEMWTRKNASTGFEKTDTPDRKSRRRNHEKNGSTYFEKHL